VAASILGALAFPDQHLAALGPGARLAGETSHEFTHIAQSLIVYHSTDDQTAPPGAADAAADCGWIPLAELVGGVRPLSVGMRKALKVACPDVDVGIEVTSSGKGKGKGKGDGTGKGAGKGAGKGKGKDTGKRTAASVSSPDAGGKRQATLTGMLLRSPKD
jgi:hypothetical protein